MRLDEVKRPSFIYLLRDPRKAVQLMLGHDWELVDGIAIFS
jgi:hypothetical protein